MSTLIVPIARIQEVRPHPNADRLPHSNGR
jgi:tRNA-binding EMAP/Myf-like protein